MTRPGRPVLDNERLSFLLNEAELSSSQLVEELADLEGVAQGLSTSEDLVYNYFGAYFLALFLDNDLNEARFLSERLPDPVQRSGNYLLELSTALLKALYTRDYPQVHQVLANASWTPVLEPLAARFKAHFEKRELALLGKAYSSMTPASAGALLGLGDNEEDIVTKLVGFGWEWDASSSLLKPRKKEGDSVIKKAVGGSEGKDTRIANLVTLVTDLTGR